MRPSSLPTDEGAKAIPEKKLPRLFWMLIDEQRITKPTSEIPLNPDWFIGIFILAYYNPHMIGQDSSPISNNQPRFSIFPVGTRTPWKINGWNMSSWRFGSDHFRF